MTPKKKYKYKPEHKTSTNIFIEDDALFIAKQLKIKKSLSRNAAVNEGLRLLGKEFGIVPPNDVSREITERATNKLLSQPLEKKGIFKVIEEAISESHTRMAI